MITFTLKSFLEPKIWYGLTVSYCLINAFQKFMKITDKHVGTLLRSTATKAEAATT